MCTLENRHRPVDSNDTPSGPYNLAKSGSAQCAIAVGCVCACDTRSGNARLSAVLCARSHRTLRQAYSTRSSADLAAGAATVPSAPSAPSALSAPSAPTYTLGRGRVPRSCALAVPAPHCHLVGSEVGGGGGGVGGVKGAGLACGV